MNNVKDFLMQAEVARKPLSKVRIRNGVISSTHLWDISYISVDLQKDNNERFVISFENSSCAERGRSEPVEVEKWMDYCEIKQEIKVEKFMRKSKFFGVKQEMECIRVKRGYEEEGVFCVPANNKMFGFIKS